MSTVLDTAQRQGVEQLVKRSKPAGKRHKSIGAFDHLPLALRKRMGYDKLRKPRMSERHWKVRSEHADHLATGGESGIRYRLHCPNVRPAEDERHAM